MPGNTSAVTARIAMSHSVMGGDVVTGGQKRLGRVERPVGGQRVAHAAQVVPLAILVRTAKPRWRIEHGYREVKQALGLAYFEGRTGRGWHHAPRLRRPQRCTPSSASPGLRRRRRRPEPVPGRRRTAATPVWNVL